MNILLGIISEYGDIIIIVLGVIVAILLFFNYINLLSQMTRIQELLERRNRKYKKNMDTHELEEEVDESASVTPDTIRRYEKKFNDCCSWHSSLAQLIPVFPLMGVLGTVAGLILALQDENDINMIFSSLNTALDTTFWGLISAIGLKIFDAICPSRTINDVEVMLDNFDKKLELANMYDDKKIK